MHKNLNTLNKKWFQGVNVQYPQLQASKVSCNLAPNLRKLKKAVTFGS